MTCRQQATPGPRIDGWMTVRPTGCHCDTLRQAEGCENRCDDSLYENRDAGPSNFVVLCLAVAALVMALLAWSIFPARADGVECKMLHQFERSCTGVKAAAKVLGREYVATLAKRCGATDEEMAQARECFAGSSSCAPVWQCTPKGPWNSKNCCVSK